MAITLRAVKGSALTYEEMDGNFAALDLRTASGWSDLLAPVSTAGIPANNAPAPANFGTAATPQRRELAFDINDYCFLQPFHINHDVKPGGLAYIHVHWSTNGTNIQPVRWECTVRRALGHNQANFGAPIVILITQAAAGTAWRHMVAECGDADALTLTEPDELVLVTLRRVANGGTENTDTVFGLMVDFHYEADRATTPSRAPNFYA
jgi:hypothetical protein